MVQIKSSKSAFFSSSLWNHMNILLVYVCEDSNVFPTLFENHTYVMPGERSCFNTKWFRKYLKWFYSTVNHVLVHSNPFEHTNGIRCWNSIESLNLNRKFRLKWQLFHLVCFGAASFFSCFSFYSAIHLTICHQCCLVTVTNVMLDS